MPEGERRRGFDRAGANVGLIEDMYRQYLDDPASVSESWRDFFSDYEPPVTAKVTKTRPAESPEVQKPAGDGDQAPRLPVAEITDEQGRSSAAPEERQPPQAEKRQPVVPTETRPVPGAPVLEGDETRPLRGASARVVENMEASLTIPTATSYRAIPVKLLEENRQIINEHLATVNRGKVSYTHIIAWAIVQALKEFPALNSCFQLADGTAHRVTRRSVNLGIAVDVERKDGACSLLVPNIKSAGEMTFQQFLAAYDDLVDNPATLRHIILITDGWSQSGAGAPVSSGGGVSVLWSQQVCASPSA